MTDRSRRDAGKSAGSAASGDSGESSSVLTYDEVGATAAAELPSGYRHLHERRQIGFDREWFVEASRRLLSWEAHRRAGLGVDAESPVSLDQTVVLRLRFGPLRFTAPVRVVDYIDTPTERGFAYGTLPGHPEIGEERFAVQIDEDDIVWAEIRAFSRPGRWFTRLGDPLARSVQDAVTRKYLRALEDGRPLPCPCCGERTLPERSAYEWCPVCDGEDDPNQLRDPHSPEHWLSPDLGPA